MNVNVNSYLVDGLVDEAVVRARAEYRRDKRGESTIVHAHHYESVSLACEPETGQSAKVSQEIPCNDKCMIYEPGFYTRPINTIGVPIEEDPA